MQPFDLNLFDFVELSRKENGVFGDIRNNSLHKDLIFDFKRCFDRSVRCDADIFTMYRGVVEKLKVTQFDQTVVMVDMHDVRPQNIRNHTMFEIDKLLLFHKRQILFGRAYFGVAHLAFDHFHLV